MNSAFNLSRILSGLSRTLNIANQVIPIYKDTKPLFNNVKNIYSLFKNNSVSTNNSTSIKAENYISNKTKKETLKSLDKNSPQFFI